MKAHSPLSGMDISMVLWAAPKEGAGMTTCKKKKE
jgi:hypothetical protein